MFGTKEQQKEMLEAIERRNESIESFGQSLGEGMKKLDEQADDLLKTTKKLERTTHKLINLPGFLKQICDGKEKMH